MIEQLLEPFQFEFFRNGLAGRDARRRAVRAGRRLRRAAGHELHRPRPVARDLRRLRGQRAARRQLLPRRRHLGRRLGAGDQRRHAPAADRRRRGDRRHHDGVVRARPRAVRALRPHAGGASTRRCSAASSASATTDVLRRRAVVGACAVGVDLLRYRPLLFTTFDPEVADVSGVNVARVDALLMLVLALTILATMQVLGVTLVAASARDPGRRRADADRLVRPDARARPRSAARAASSG